MVVFWVYFLKLYFFSKNTTTPPPPLPIRLANMIHDKHVGIEHSHNDHPPSPNSQRTRNNLFFRTKKVSSPLPRLSRFLTICFGFEVTMDSDPSFLERLSPTPWRRSHWWIPRHVHGWCVGVRLNLVREKRG
jgi:hypothetical protein